MSSQRSRELRSALTEYIEQGLLQQQDIDRAVELAGLTVDEKCWRKFIQTILIWVGGVSLSVGAIFFVAANWQHLGRFGKFLLLEFTVLASLIPYFYYSRHPHIQQVSLLSATLLTGGLLALFGQTYQTGADPWQLFLNWALLTFPWVMLSRFHVLWFVWLALLNISIQQYFDVFGDYSESVMGLFLLNSSALILWQGCARKYEWLNKAWAINLLGVMSGLYATLLFVDHLFHDKFVGVLCWCTWCAANYIYYRHAKLNVFMLSGICLSSLIAVISVVVWALPDPIDPGATFLLLMFITIAGGSGSVVWLKELIKDKGL